MKLLCRIHLLLLLIFLSLANGYGQESEMVLTFRNPSWGVCNIDALLVQDSIKLPVSEVFNILNLNTETKNDRQLYLSTHLLEQRYGLCFQADMRTQTLDLYSKISLPVEKQKARNRLRRILSEKQIHRNYDTLLFPRHRKIVSGGMLDYFTGYSKTDQAYNAYFSVTGGMELFGGALQGNVNGYMDQNYQGVHVNDLAWQFVFPENRYITSFSAGQISTTGLIPGRIIGISATNNPVRQIRTGETYVLDGYTLPDSEIELYINNQLTDFTRADGSGYYRFDYPVCYGAVRTSIRIYTPSGQVQTENRDTEIPFTFLQKGALQYHLQAGVPDDGIKFNLRQRTRFSGDIGYGLGAGITLSAGGEYPSETGTPFYYGRISARLSGALLLSADLAPDLFYRGTANILLARNLVFNSTYTEFTGRSWYNPSGVIRDISANLYFPFHLAGMASVIRFHGNYNVMAGKTYTSGQTADLSMKNQNLELVFTYSGSLTGLPEAGILGHDDQFRTIITYNVRRKSGLPVYSRGTFIRADASYLLSTGEILTCGLQLSQTLGKIARLQLGGGYNFSNQMMQYQATLNIDLRPVRSTTWAQVDKLHYAVTQHFSGSLGFNSPHEGISTGTLSQTGQGAVAIRVFIDENANSRYDKGEVILKVGVRGLDETNQVSHNRHNILFIRQLQSYWQYNCEILLVAGSGSLVPPETSQFSFIVDPNRCKPIDIPLKISGAASNQASFMNNNEPVIINFFNDQKK